MKISVDNYEYFNQLLGTYNIVDMADMIEGFKEEENNDREQALYEYGFLLGMLLVFDKLNIKTSPTLDGTYIINPTSVDMEN